MDVIHHAQKCDTSGAFVGTTHIQPALDMCVYEVNFPDGHSEELAANAIAEALYIQFTLDGNVYVLLDSILDY